MSDSPTRPRHLNLVTTVDTAEIQHLSITELLAYLETKEAEIHEAIAKWRQLASTIGETPRKSRSGGRASSAGEESELHCLGLSPSDECADFG